MRKVDVEAAWARVFEASFLLLVSRGMPHKTAVLSALEAAGAFRAELEKHVEVEKRARGAKFATAAREGLSTDGQALLDLYERHERLQKVPRPLIPAMVRRINIGAKQGIPAWEARFKIIRGSEYLMGKSSKFQATLAWLLQARVQEDIDSGKYV